MRAILVWREHGEQQLSPMKAPAEVSELCSADQLAALRAWAEQLTGQACADALALMALTCGVSPGELAAARGGHLRRLLSRR
ncbi:hypothetical protein [Nonomuraea sp. NPDC003709]|uniref:hypothetical protein n=1 Tax=Nonomuraea sp. NPDC003709 TaxID=3154450 RepID=UPI0033B4B0B2